MVEHRLIGVAEAAVFDLHDDDRVVVNRVPAHDPSEHPGGYVLQKGEIERAGRPMVADEALVVVGRHFRRDVAIAGAEDVDDDVIGLLDGSPGAGDPRHVEGGERWHGCERGERGGREPDRLPVGITGGHDRHPRGQSPESELEG